MSQFLRDAIERIIATYLQAFLGLLAAAAATPFDVSSLRAAALAAAPAALAAAKALFARQLGDPESASLLRDVRETVLPNC